MEDDVLKQLLKKANMGDASSQYKLGEYYETKDFKKSEYWYTKASDQNHIDAIYSLADFYNEGVKELRDKKKALTLYLKCAELRDINNHDSNLAFSACKDIAQFYEKGIVVEKDMPTAIEWYEKASENRSVLLSDDYEKMASYYEKNDYGQQNYSKAARYYVEGGYYRRAAAIYREKLNDTDRALYYTLKQSDHCYSLPIFQLQSHEKIDYNHIDECFKAYYLNTFSKDVQAYYKLKLFNNMPINFSESCSPFHRNEKTLRTDSIIHYHFFSLTTYFISLFPQVIGKVLGYRYAEYFFMATGWPWLNCGMGGMLSPTDIIYESDLRPAEQYVADYLFIFDKVKDYMLDDFLKFIKGNQPNLNSTAYQNIIEKIGSQPFALKDIETECEIQNTLYINWIVNPTIIPRSRIIVSFDGDE